MTDNGYLKEMGKIAPGWVWSQAILADWMVLLAGFTVQAGLQVGLCDEQGLRLCSVINQSLKLCPKLRRVANWA